MAKVTFEFNEYLHSGRVVIQIEYGLWPTGKAVSRDELGVLFLPTASHAPTASVDDLAAAMAADQRLRDQITTLLERAFQAGAATLKLEQQQLR